MKVLDLFSGIGGFSLGLERAGMQTVAFCEIDPFCRKVLKKHWPDVPIFEDVRELKGTDVGSVDLVCGGYPCQPFSVAGKRAGAEDDRHLWPEVRRLLSETGAGWFVGENVAGHISMGLDEVLSDLESLGYTAQTFVIPAVAVDAPHRRDRIWLVANSNRDRRQGERPRRNPGETKSDVKRRSTGGIFAADASDTYSLLPQPGRTLRRVGGQEQVSGDSTWKITSQPFVRRRNHGIPNRVDRLRALGNAVVPQIPEIIGRAIMEIEGYHQGRQNG